MDMCRCLALAHCGHVSVSCTGALWACVPCAGALLAVIFSCESKALTGKGVWNLAKKRKRKKLDLKTALARNLTKGVMEREEIEKQRASAHYHMLHSQGKTAEARADLARLAIIKQQREEAAKKREAEKADAEYPRARERE
ncbi:unnamed protein product [Nesidiocoris tenuis]|uniref:Casein kinase substrate phosphoprotein PP28 domain-containing protein n=1 Tax=Nesidiocoris tenuis TaxID=355587 RepID=A0A6H5G664_9HEMI|nr:unnamed protein product [Nesidiocoris tenuis]